MQTLDLVDAMRADCGALADTVLRVDGGMVASDWTMQRLADVQRQAAGLASAVAAWPKRGHSSQDHRALR
jgi:glycerol kinase